jgi:hypothetical protein
MRVVIAGLDSANPGNDASSTASCAGSTRASISFREEMDCRVKPGNDQHCTSCAGST